jgi:phosphate transport system permease protein
VEGNVISDVKRPRSMTSAADDTFRNVIIALASVVLIAIVLYAIVLVAGGAPALAREGLGFIFGLEWNPGTERFQALPFIAGSFFTALGALVVAVPLAVAAALFIAEYAPKWLAVPVGYMIEMLAAIPSVVYGLWGIFVLIPAVRGFQVWLVGVTGLDWTPTGIGLMSAILVLAVMVIPYICAIARDVIQLVPNDQREAAYALGATKWEVIRYGILPYARAGILGGVILGLGRAIGETLAVTMVIGNAGEIAKNLFSSTATMSSLIASQFGEAGGTQLSALIALGFLLLVFSVIVNLFARVVITKLTPVGTRL